MNGYLVFVIVLLLFSYLLNLLISMLNLRAVSEEIPDEFKGVYDEEKYAKSQRYLRVNTKFGTVESTLMLPLTLLFILLGGFGWINRVALGAGWGMIPSGLLFAGMLMLISQVISLPFGLYDTFVIEERFGFNRTSMKTFVLDRLKGLALTVVIGAPVLALVLWFFGSAGPWAWVYCWGALTVIQIVLMYVAPVIFLPLFNKFTPLEEGELKEAITHYAEKTRFTLSGIFKIDGSRRSSKSNAYFTGFGRWRRIALYDTLIANHSIAELLSILAHEVGHNKLGHIRKQLLIGLCSSGLMLYVLSLFLTQPGLYEAFGVAYEPVHGTAVPLYAGIVFFGFLFTPISMIIGVFGNILSRRFEYQADAFAAETTGDGASMIDALKKLSVDNLSNLTPHPLKVFLEYSHPPVLERIRAIRAADGR